MVSDHFTEVAGNASARYQNVLDIFRNLLTGAQTQSFSARRLAILRQQANDVAVTFLQSEREWIKEVLFKTALNALQSARKDLGGKSDTNLPETLRSYLAQSEEYLEGEVRAQLFRDIEAICRSYREFAVAADMLSRSTGVSSSHAISSISSGGRFKFMFRDRIGRLYAAQKYIRSVWRHTLVCLSVEFYILEASSLGAEKFTINHPDATSAWAEVEFDLDPESSVNFQAIREEVFHPNSNYSVKAA